METSEREPIIIDVREFDEFAAERIENSIHMPLSNFAWSAPGILKHFESREILFMCQTGNGAKLAVSLVRQLGYSESILTKVYEGGILEWKSQGKPMIRENMAHLPIMRQVQLTVGLLIVSSVALGIFENPWFLAGTAFFGAGLIFAGITGFCGLALLLSKMPWNSTDQ